MPAGRLACVPLQALPGWRLGIPSSSIPLQGLTPPIAAGDTRSQLISQHRISQLAKPEDSPSSVVSPRRRQGLSEAAESLDSRTQFGDILHEKDFTGIAKTARVPHLVIIHVLRIAPLSGYDDGQFARFARFSDRCRATVRNHDIGLRHKTTQIHGWDQRSSLPPLGKRRGSVLNVERAAFRVLCGDPGKLASKSPHRLLMRTERYEDHTSRPITEAFG